LLEKGSTVCVGFCLLGEVTGGRLFRSPQPRCSIFSKFRGGLPSCRWSSRRAKSGSKPCRRHGILGLKALSGRRLCIVIEAIVALDASPFGHSQSVRKEIESFLDVLIDMGISEARRLEEALRRIQ
jgi:hypothetical protein